MRNTRFKSNDCVKVIGSIPELKEIEGSRGVIVGFALDAKEIDYGVLVEADAWLGWQIPESQITASPEKVFPPWFSKFDPKIERPTRPGPRTFSQGSVDRSRA
jgi:hypothetical protein